MLAQEVAYVTAQLRRLLEQVGPFDSRHVSARGVAGVAGGAFLLVRGTRERLPLPHSQPRALRHTTVLLPLSCGRDGWPGSAPPSPPHGSTWCVCQARPAEPVIIARCGEMERVQVEVEESESEEEAEAPPPVVAAPPQHTDDEESKASSRSSSSSSSAPKKKRRKEEKKKGSKRREKEKKIKKKSKKSKKEKKRS